MQYRSDKHGNMLSILGYGCMRFTKKGNSIDIDKAEQEILAAYRPGRLQGRRKLLRHGLYLSRQRGGAGRDL